MISILYISREKTNPVLERTIKQHADIYSVPFFIITHEEVRQFSNFVKENIKTSHLFIANENTYLNVKILDDVLKIEPNQQFTTNHFVDNKLDLDCGFLVQTSLLHFFNPSEFTTSEKFSEEMTAYISTMPNLPISLRPGFNKLNFECSSYKKHICDKCKEIFTNSPVIVTLGNMSEEDMIKYHTVNEKIRTGKNVQIAIALMIKDEEQKISETLNYYKNSLYFPEIYILDTGSTDKTLEKVKEWAKHHPLTKIIIQEQPFVDFSTSRNYLLDHIYENSKCEYIMSIDCNDELVGQDDCIKYLGALYQYPTIFVDQVWRTHGADPITFTNVRIIKNNKQYRWKYRVHEVLISENNCSIVVRLPNTVHLFQFRDPEYETVKSARYHRDLKYFLEDYQHYPDDRRIVYYLSQTYYFCQDYENAIVYAKKRIQMNKPDEKDEEVYQCILRIGKCKQFLNKPAHEIAKWHWFGWEYFDTGKKDIEPLIHLVHYYKTKNDYETARSLCELACRTEKPNFNLPLRHELYHTERYKQLAEIYYKLKLYEKSYETYKELLKQPIADELRKRVEHIVKMYYPSYTNPKPLLAIYGGFFYDRPWNGKMFYEKTISLGGSESMVIKLAHLLKEHYNVYVFTNTPEDIVYDQVTYLNLQAYNEFIKVNKIKHLIISRDVAKTPEPDNKSVEHTHLWVHDLTHINELKYPERYTSIITLSTFHKKFYEDFIETLRISPPHKKLLKSKIRIVPNIVESNRLNFKTVKQLKKESNNENHEMRFIYSSCPTRGLIKVVNDFSMIKKIFPNAHLYIYSDFANDFVLSRMPFAPQYVEMLKTIDGVHLIGRLPEHQFLEECKKATIWYYPTDFQETFCITAVQMMMNGVIPIYSDVGALPNVIGDAGINLSKEKKDIVTILKELDNEKRNQLMKKGVERAKQYVDSVVKDEWTKLLN